MAIKVSSGHLVPVIVQASSRGRPAMGERPRPARWDSASRSRPGSLAEVIAEHRPDGHRRGRTPLMAVPPNTMTGPGSRGKRVNRLGQVTIAHPAWSQD